MTSVELYWANFYELMEKLNMEDDYEQFEELLENMFEKQFSTKFQINWLDNHDWRTGTKALHKVPMMPYNTCIDTETLWNT